MVRVTERGEVGPVKEQPRVAVMLPLVVDVDGRDGPLGLGQALRTDGFLAEDREPQGQPARGAIPAAHHEVRTAMFLANGAVLTAAADDEVPATTGTRAGTQ